MSESGAELEGDGAGSADPEVGWFFIVDGEQRGPVTEAEFARLRLAGRVQGDTLVWRPGFVQWIPYEQIADTMPMGGALAGRVGLTYFKGREEPTNIFGWWWKVLRDDYVNFSGRARRKEFWSFLLVHVLILLGLYMPGSFLTSLSSAGWTVLLGTGFMVAGFVYHVATLAAYLALVVRRLHDSGKSGWWLMVVFVPYIGGIILLITMILDSEPGANKYGNNPKYALRYR